MSQIRSGRMMKVLGVTAGALVMTSVQVSAANAAGSPWGTIYAVDRGNKAAAAYGDFANNGGVYATVGANYADMLNDGNAVYVQVNFSFWKKDHTGEWNWVPDSKRVQSPRSSRFVYVGVPLSRKLDPSATGVRAHIKVCEDINNTTDICSPSAIKSFNY